MANELQSLESITQELNTVVLELTHWSSNLDEGSFFKSLENKWSTAGQIDHLRKSSAPLILILRLPKILIRWLLGKPNRDSRSYEAVVEKYQKKLASVTITTTRFYPDLGHAQTKKKVLDKYLATSQKLIRITSKWKDSDLDRYIIPHPLLGKLTVREMLFFTIYHTKHHHNSVANLYGSME